jgi:hypothetical protein
LPEGPPSLSAAQVRASSGRKCNHKQVHCLPSAPSLRCGPLRLQFVRFQLQQMPRKHRSAALTTSPTGPVAERVKSRGKTSLVPTSHPSPHKKRHMHRSRASRILSTVCGRGAEPRPQLRGRAGGGPASISYMTNTLFDHTQAPTRCTH